MRQQTLADGTQSPIDADVRLIVTMGDPAGIGPEVLAREIHAGSLDAAQTTIVGHEPTLQRCLRTVSGQDSEIGAAILDPTPDKPDTPFAPGKPSAATGAAALTYVRVGLELVLEHQPSALVTGPLSKYWVEKSQPGFRGHTELLARTTHTREFLMTMVGGGLRVGVLTTHIPLRDVSPAIKVKRVVSALRLITESTYLFAHEGTPRVAVCGLNPHAGEQGLIGREDESVIEPAIRKARADGVAAFGPFPADTVFRRAREGEFDFVLAMYHDQGLIPVKLVAGDGAVNVTLGLPFVRTSVDHGTAFDIAGDNQARSDSMARAIGLARRYAALRYDRQSG